MCSRHRRTSHQSRRRSAESEVQLRPNRRKALAVELTKARFNTCICRRRGGVRSHEPHQQAVNTEANLDKLCSLRRDPFAFCNVTARGRIGLGGSPLAFKAIDKKSVNDAVSPECKLRNSVAERLVGDECTADCRRMSPRVACPRRISRKPILHSQLQSLGSRARQTPLRTRSTYCAAITALPVTYRT